MAQYSITTEHHEGRAMWHRVRTSTTHTELEMARANHYQTRNTGRHYVKYMTAYFVCQHPVAQNALKLFPDE